MADHTKIEWADATVNYLNGCSVISAGCTNCYAMRLAGTRLKHHPSRAGLTADSKAGPVWTGETRAWEPELMKVLRWKRPRRIFWNAHGDLFHDSVPDAVIDRQWAVMALTPQHTPMVLTKRPERMRAYIAGFYWERAVESCRTESGSSMIVKHSIDSLRGHFGLRPRFNSERDASAWPLPNVWLGTSVEDQRAADERIPHLLATPAAVRFLSCEPLLGPVDLRNIDRGNGISLDAITGYHSASLTFALKDGPHSQPFPILPKQLPRIDLVIAGGESGPGARPMHPGWARSLRDQCAAAGAAFLFKQWGDWIGESQVGWLSPMIDTHNCRWEIVAGESMYRIGKARAGRLLDGRTHDEYPGSVANG